MKSSKPYTLRSLLNSVNKDEVFQYIYNKDQKWAHKSDRCTLEGAIKSYSPVIDELLSKPKVRAYKMPLCVRYQKDWMDEKADPYIEVVLLNEKFVAPAKGLKPWGCRKGEKPPKGYYNVNDNKHSKYFAFGWEPWSKIVDTPIILEDKAKKLSDVAVVAEILWELTFYGWTEKSCEDKKNDITESMDKAIKEIDAGNVIEILPKKEGQYKIVIPDSVSKQLNDIFEKNETRRKDSSNN